MQEEFLADSQIFTESQQEREEKEKKEQDREEEIVYLEDQEA